MTRNTTKEHRSRPTPLRARKRTAITAGMIALVLVGLFGHGRIDSTDAQEGTPPTELGGAGAVFEPLAFGDVSQLPPAPASFQLVRLRIAPGGHVTVPADDPGLVLILVESGTLTSTNTTPVRVLRSSLMGTSDAEPFEDVAAGATVTLGPGDSFVGPPRSGGEYRNDGSDELVLLISGLSPEPAATATP